jgi:hypothetical protein
MEPTTQQYGAATPQQYEPQPNGGPVSVKMVAGFAVAAILLALVGTAKGVILGGSTTVTALAPTQPLSGVISQALGPNVNGSMMVPGKDYQLTVTYFDSNAWAVAYINPLRNNFDPSYAILKQNKGFYQVVLGPESALPSGQVQGLPADVAAYIHAHAAVYQSSNGQ